jgi:hypothetical protein
MNKQERIEFKLRPALQECWLHQTRLHAAWQEAINFPAIKDIAIHELNDAEVRTLDQLVFRFGKLQDAIGSRLLPAILQILQEWQEHEAFLDKLNRAEKIGLLPSVDKWLLLRELRNQTAHEYPEHPEVVIANLRHLVTHVPMLEQSFLHLAGAANARILTPNQQDNGSP